MSYFFHLGRYGMRRRIVSGSGDTVAPVSDDRGWSSYFIDLRGRYVNDRAWYGLGLLAIGIGALNLRPPVVGRSALCSLGRNARRVGRRWA